MSRNTTATKVCRYAVTLPGSAAPASIRSLLIAAGMPDSLPLGNILGLKITESVPGGTTDRAAFYVGSVRLGTGLESSSFTATDITTHGQHVAAGLVYDEPVDMDVDSYICSVTTSPIPALVVVYLV